MTLNTLNAESSNTTTSLPSLFRSTSYAAVDGSAGASIDARVTAPPGTAARAASGAFAAGSPPSSVSALANPLGVALEPDDVPADAQTCARWCARRCVLAA